MKFAGWQECSFCDCEDSTSFVAFTAGCNLRCKFCHNVSAVKPLASNLFDAGELLSALKKTKADSFVLSGGEPLLVGQEDEVIRFVSDVVGSWWSRGKPRTVKLDTNGQNPDGLAKVLGTKMFDYVAIDVKAGSEKKYKELCGDNASFSSVLESIAVVRFYGIPWEARITVVDGFHDESDIKSISAILADGETVYLQKYRTGDNLCPDKSWNEPSDELIDRFIRVGQSMGGGNFLPRQ